MIQHPLVRLQQAMVAPSVYILETKNGISVSGRNNPICNNTDGTKHSSHKTFQSKSWQYLLSASLYVLLTERQENFSLVLVSRALMAIVMRP